MMDSSKLPLRSWFLAMDLISQDETGLSALALKRHLGLIEEGRCKAKTLTAAYFGETPRR
jgi:hypothetical protein